MLLFGNAPLPHYAVNIALHLACAGSLFVLARSLSASAPMAAVAGLAFAAHPTAFSAAAWLSDRFDLLATLFGFMSLIAVSRFSARGSRGWAVCAIVAVTVSMFSKETGFVFPLIAVFLLAVPDAKGHAVPARARVGLGIGMVMAMLVSLGVRTVVVKAGADSIFFGRGLVTTVAEGALKWARYLPDFIVAEAGNVSAVLAWLAAIQLVMLAALIAVGRRAYGRPLVRAIVVGVGLMLLSGLVQSPVILASPVHPYELAGGRSGALMFDWLVSNRFYYLSLAGFFIALAAVADGAYATMRGWGGRGVAILGLVLATIAISALLSSARAVGRDWARFTRTQDAALIEAAGILADSQAWLPGCKIFLLDTHAHSRSFLYAADVIVKHRLPRGHPLMGCLVQTEVAPWFHVADWRKVASVAPLQVITNRGRPYEPLVVGNLAVYYLRIPDSDEVRRDPEAHFFEFDGKRFVDVTAGVREGTRPVRFWDNRPPA